MLQFTRFVKRYGRNIVLDIPELHIRAGTHLLKGVNGSGKSSLLRAMAGMIPFEGELTFQGEVPLHQDHQKQRQLISICEAEPCFPGFLSGQYLLDMYLQLREGSRDQADKICEALHIGPWINQKIGTYSSGMNKKLGLLLALVGTPKLILLDEPFNTLDHASQQSLQELIQQGSDGACNFILASHQQIDSVRIKFDQHWEIQAQRLQPLSLA